MKMEFVKNIKKINLNEFEYSTLDQNATQNFIMSIARLFDTVFETPNNDFENYTHDHPTLRQSHPADLFANFFNAIDEEECTKYQRQFIKFAQVNINTIFKWYRKNNASVNISPKQIEWFKRWFSKHNVGHEFLNELDPSYKRSIKPNFNKFFKFENSVEGEFK